MVVDAHHALRSRGQTHPRLVVPPRRSEPVAERAALDAAQAAALVHLEAASPNKSVHAALEALEACAGLAPGSTLEPWALDAAKMAKAGNARALQDASCDSYREAFEALRQALADWHAQPVLELIGSLLERFGEEYAAAKAARGGVDFEDLELGVRDLLAADEALRRRWQDRFKLIMLDEFQDTNRLQLEVLHLLADGNDFAVGDEFQSIYAFRHADVQLFRERRRALEAGVKELTVNFRSAPEILGVVNVAFRRLLPDFSPLENPGAEVTGRARVELQLSAEKDAGVPVAWTGLGLAHVDAPDPRRAQARRLAHRIREEVEAGRSAGDIVILVRATASLALFEEALAEHGLPTYVVGGRGYWSHEQVRDGLAYLSVLANPRDEEALYGVLASPFCGAGADTLIALAQAGRGRGIWAALPDVLPEIHAFLEAERQEAERLPAEVLLERAVAHTGYDLAVLARPGGDRRLANLRKLMRLAREYERAEGRDLRGFLAWAADQDRPRAKEGEAPLESDGLEAIRLMTIHAAKGLEFPVVCVADLGRSLGSHSERLLIGRDGSLGLGLVMPGGGSAVKALDFERIAAERAEESEQEERRLFYVAMTRAEELLILSGTAKDLTKWREPGAGGPPLEWLTPALLGDDPAGVLGGDPELGAAPDRIVPLAPDAPLRIVLNTPDTLPAAALRPRPRERALAAGTHLPPRPRLEPSPSASRGEPRRISYSTLQSHGRCGYRFYLQRELGLPDVEPPPGIPAPGAAAGLDPRVRGTLVHQLLEDLDFGAPLAPTPEGLAALGVSLTAEQAQDLCAMVTAFGASDLCARLARAERVRREAGFLFALSGELVNGFIDVLADEPTGALVVDYKSDRLSGASPHALVERDYKTQRIVYALAALEGGYDSVEVVYCFLEVPGDTVSATFTKADLAGLRARLGELAAGVFAGRYEPTATPHRDLCADCPGRRALCSYPESVTLAPLAAEADETPVDSLF
jgi:ATP-dependent helicase/nuclease subunit A